jgi:hypothetical protein
MTGERHDDTDYDQRTLANLTATIALLLVAIAIVWTLQQIERESVLEGCVVSGRIDCLDRIGAASGAASAPRR